MKISVVISTYNGANFIQEQLYSISNQLVLPDEVIISDDCSSDNTIELIEKFKESSPFPIYIFKNESNLGYSKNFNSALLRSSGDLIFLCDQDDYWYNTKISTIKDLYINYPGYFVYMNDALLTDQSLVSVNLSKLQQIYSTGLDDSYFIMGCCSAVRREFLDIIMPIPDNINEHDGWINYIAHGLNRKYITKEILQFYRRHDLNTSKNIVNSLHPINIISIVKFRLKHKFDFISKIEFWESYLANYKLIRNNIPLELEDDFTNFIKINEHKLYLLKLRFKNRNLFFPLRFIFSIKLFLLNKVKKEYKFRNLIQDFFKI
jgi:glycosyltransferase involved in cell wall biosynthesis